jgi:7,8-dihydropterin-6-yl-methyl-4-(beta-D-ribofuranosyl)aminobenzene 5'-phosphate synthase
VVNLTILCENSVVPCHGLLGEHGFSVLIEKENKTFLFDTGQGHTIVQNAKVLNKDLNKISKIFLSHGHFDHTGGLIAVVKECGRMNVYAHPDVFNERFAVTNENGKDKIRSVGFPEEKEDLCALGAVFHFNTTFEEVFKGVFLTGEIPRKTLFEKEDKRLAVIEKNEMKQDPFKDDQSLVIKTEKGLVVILGCSHSGMINTLDHIKGYFTNENFHMVIGGTHMGFLDDLQVEKTIESLKVFNIDRIGVSHCTGLQAAASLKQAFGKKFCFAQAGTILTVN